MAVNHPPHPEYEVGVRSDKKSDATGSSKKACWSAKQVWSAKKNKGGVPRMEFDGWATGKGVMVAVIDTGIDVAFPGFVTIKGTKTKPMFSSRIVAYWDMYYKTPSYADTQKVARLTGLPEKRAMGRIYEKAEIETFLNTTYGKGPRTPPKAHPSKDRQGHGTACAALAASHGFAGDTKQPIGIAPKADILAVSYIRTCPDDSFLRAEANGTVSPIDWPDLDHEKQLRTIFAFIRSVTDDFAKKERGTSIGQTPIVVSMSFSAPNGYAHAWYADDSFEFFVLRHHNKKGTALVTGASNDNYAAHGVTSQAHWGPVSSATPATGAAGTTTAALPIKIVDQRTSTLSKFEPNCTPQNISKPLNSPVYLTIGVPRKPSDITSSGHDPFKISVYVQKPGTPDKGRVLPLHKDSDASNPAKTTIETDGKSYGAEVVKLGAFSALNLSITGDNVHHGTAMTLYNIAVSPTIETNAPFTTSSASSHCATILKDDVTLWIELTLPDDAVVQANADIPSKEHGVGIGPSLLTVRPDTSTGATANDVVATTSSVAFSNAPKHRIADANLHDEVITVGGTVLGDRTRAYRFSNRGPVRQFFASEPVPTKPNLSAPADNVWVSWYPTSLVGWKQGERKGKATGKMKDGSLAVPPRDRKHGTSLSCPIVAGTAALMFEQWPDMTYKQCIAILEKTADASGLGTNGPAEQGAGSLRALEAVKQAAKKVVP